MKKKSPFNSLLFFINSLLAIILLLSYLLPYISPKSTPFLAILSLFLPALLVVNLLFAIYWIVRLKKQFLLSAIIVAIGYNHIDKTFKFSEKKTLLNNDLKIMSYNVRMFNHYGWKKEDDSIPQKITRLIEKASPDILVVQEFYEAKDLQIYYPHKYIKTKSKTSKFGLATFSRFPIIASGSLDLENTSNNITYTDILKESDTIRIYNVHLESLGIRPDKENFGEKDSDQLIKRMKKAFKKQAIQTEQLLIHLRQWTGKTIICGDFNNTAFSWVYKEIAKGKKDAFVEAGKGLGKTFNYSYPVRIDFILPDKSFEVNYFKTFDHKYSDHYPILARVNLNDE